MWSRIFAGILASATFFAACAPAMSASQGRPCTLLNGEKLPPEAGGADAICSAIEQAIAAKAPKVRYTAEVRVLSKSGLSVSVVANGKKLPDQNMSVMDRNLNPWAIKRFAEGLADEVAKAGSKT
jgi:hypothetical protein